MNKSKTDFTKELEGTSQYFLGIHVKPEQELCIN